MSELKELSHIEKFGGSAYNVWKFQMSAALRGAELQAVFAEFQMTAQKYLQRPQLPSG